MPFDWLRQKSLKGLLKLLKTNFESFLDVTYVKEATKFPLMSSEDLFDEVKEKRTKVYKNKALKIDFFHDFAENTTFEDVRDKYDRRIARFFETIQKKCIFIRDDKYFKEKDIADYNELYKILLEHNSEHVLVLILNTFKGDFNLDGLDNNIKVYKNEKNQTKWQNPIICEYINDCMNASMSVEDILMFSGHS